MSSIVRPVVAAVLASGLPGGAAPALAKEYQVAMVDRGPEGSMAFAPGFLRIAPGDTVRFVPRDKGHNVESIPGLQPAGAPAFKGGIGQELVVTFKAPGLYGYKCLPHYALGMVGLIEVGSAPNRAGFQGQLAKMPPFARNRLSGYLKQVP